LSVPGTWVTVYTGDLGNVVARDPSAPARYSETSLGEGAKPGANDEPNRILRSCTAHSGGTTRNAIGYGVARVTGGMIGADFREFGSSGRIYDSVATLDALIPGGRPVPRVRSCSSRTSPYGPKILTRFSSRTSRDLHPDPPGNHPRSAARFGRA
jgi:hypothetical protein